MRISLDSFMAVASRSELLDAATLAGALERFRARQPGLDDAKAFAESLVQDNLITVWQADKLLLGKHRGFTLGRYRLLSLLGKGGMSSVYLAEHQVMKRRCAVKVLPTRQAKNSAYITRFHREARAVASLDHPNIVRAYDIDKATDGTMELHFLVMEYVAGKTLFELVRNAGPLRVKQAADYIRQAALGLAHAHKAGLIHRDIKPENLIVDPTGTLKVMDLGLARFYDSNEEQLTINQDERVLGTANYCSPEQAVDSHMVDARTDIYSLGCTFFYLLMGHPPFNTGTLAQRLIAHQSKEPPPIELKRPDVPKELIALIKRMMAKNPELRIQSATEVADQLLPFVSAMAPAPKAEAPAPAFRDAKTPAPKPSETRPIQPFSVSEPERQETHDTDANHESPTAQLTEGGAERFFEELSDPQSAEPPTAPLSDYLSPIGISDEQAVGLTSTESAIEFELPPETEVPAVTPKTSTGSIPVVGKPGAARGRAMLIAAALAVVILPTAWWAYGLWSNREPARPLLTGAETVIDVGPRGHFGTVTEAVNAIVQRFPKIKTIHVAPGAQLLERIVIDGGAKSKSPPNLQIVCAGKPPAILKPADPQTPILQASNVDGLVIDGLEFDAQGRDVAIRLSGFLVESRLAHCTIRGFARAGIEAQNVSGYPDQEFHIEDSTIQGNSPKAVGIRCTANGTSRNSEMMFHDLRLIGPLAAGVEFIGPTWNVTIDHSILHETQAGIRFAQSNQDVRGLAIFHDTFSRCESGLDFAGQPSLSSSPLQFRCNLFVQQKGPEVVVETGLTDEVAKQLVPGSDVVRNNVSDRAVSEASSGLLGVFINGGKSGVETPNFLSTNPADANFLKPADDALKTDTDDKGYIGAVSR